MSCEPTPANKRFNRSRGPGGSTFCDTNFIRTNWHDLASGLNVDRKRLFEETRPPKSFAALPTKMTADALSRAKAATVKIGEAGKKPTFSGVIIPDGYVLTCAHHDCVPGDQLEIALPDEEFLFCLKGSCRLTVSGKKYELHEGDAATFWCAEPHSYAPSDQCLSEGQLPVLVLSVWISSVDAPAK